MNDCCKMYLEEWAIEKDHLKAEIEYHREETQLVAKLLTEQTSRLRKIYKKYKELADTGDVEVSDR